MAWSFNWHVEKRSELAMATHLKVVVASVIWRVKIHNLPGKHNLSCHGQTHLKLQWKNVFWFHVKTHHKKLLNLPWQHILKVAMASVNWHVNELEIVMANSVC